MGAQRAVGAGSERMHTATAPTISITAELRCPAGGDVASGRSGGRSDAWSAVGVDVKVILTQPCMFCIENH
jgi:hypothetical protein